MSALLDNGIEVTALHNHFFWEEPHVYFMHVHGMGKTADLAKRIKPGLDLIGHTQAAAAAPGGGGSTAPLHTAHPPTLVRHERHPTRAPHKITVRPDPLTMTPHPPPPPPPPPLTPPPASLPPPPPPPTPR